MLKKTRKVDKIFSARFRLQSLRSFPDIRRLLVAGESFKVPQTRLGFYWNAFPNKNKKAESSTRVSRGSSGFLHILHIDERYARMNFMCPFSCCERRGASESHDTFTQNVEKRDGFQKAFQSCLTRTSMLF